MRTVRWNKDPVSAATHFAGFLAAIAGLVFLVWRSPSDGPKLVGMAAYGGSLVALFLASSLFHFVDLGERRNRWLQRLDHAAIFGLIAGSYLPPLLHLLDGAWRVTMIAVVVGLAITGAIFKFAWIDCPTWLSTAIYLVLGWIVIIPAPLLLPQIPAAPLTWLLAGGAAYSIGALVYLFEWPDPLPDRVGHHEVWHLFVLAGAGAHFVFTTWLLDVARPPFA
jgi:hemolysin III